ncbi:muscular LMNA-interacting protein isoform X4 [Eleginops maclovinus]|uniref:muscular LMNA-interacting protein isoform X4 n=1 Tax=Eleginops maclovinus TaxID=56733 RepID=UPI0030805596
MDGLKNSLGKISIGVPSIFTFVPVVQQLPIKSIVSEEDIPGALPRKPNKNFTVSHEKTTGETMSHREIFKVFIKDSMEGGAGNTIQQGTKLRTHKIKLRYKSLAAIPTNTLLMDQQAIDEQVEREESPCDRLSVGEIIDRGVEDTHAEMCSPAELRQQSEELYAVIDEILAFSIPPSKASQSSTTIVGLQNNSSFAKSLGRETKYASVCSLHPSTGVNRKQINPKKTKPGVIRPMTAIPRLTVEDEEEFHPNPFRPFGVKQNSTANKKMASMNLSDAGKDFYTTSNGQKRGPFSGCELQIKEPEIR